MGKLDQSQRAVMKSRAPVAIDTIPNLTFTATECRIDLKDLQRHDEPLAIDGKRDGKKKHSKGSSPEMLTLVQNDGDLHSVPDKSATAKCFAEQIYSWTVV